METKRPSKSEKGTDFFTDFIEKSNFKKQKRNRKFTDFIEKFTDSKLIFWSQLVQSKTLQKECTTNLHKYSSNNDVTEAQYCKRIELQKLKKEQTFY